MVVLEYFKFIMFCLWLKERNINKKTPVTITITGVCIVISPNYFFIVSSIANCYSNCSTTIGLLPIPKRPIIFFIGYIMGKFHKYKPCLESIIPKGIVNDYLDKYSCLFNIAIKRIVYILC